MILEDGNGLKAEELIDMLALLATAGKILLCGQRNEFIG
jgi:hypothetical protein